MYIPIKDNTSTLLTIFSFSSCCLDPSWLKTLDIISPKMDPKMWSSMMVFRDPACVLTLQSYRFCCFSFETNWTKPSKTKNQIFPLYYKDSKPFRIIAHYTAIAATRRVNPDLLNLYRTSNVARKPNPRITIMFKPGIQYIDTNGTHNVGVIERKGEWGNKCRPYNIIH